MRIISSTGFFVTILVLISCSKKSEPDPVVAKGNRQVAVHVTQAESNSYDTDFLRVKALGIDVVPITISWNQMETDTGFDFSTLEIIDIYYPAKNTKVSLNITPFNAASRALPSDLQTKDFNDASVISRFKALIDSIHKKLPNTQVNDFIIGVEADLYLSGHNTEWNTFKSFYDSARVYIKSKWGASMPVGVEITWNAATTTDKENTVSLNEHSDMMALSYYPNQADFTVKPPSIVHSDIAAVIALYPSIPVFVVECGYQTSANCNSSDELQRQFVAEMFKLWDDNAEKINFIGFLWLTDLSDAAVDKYVADYGGSSLPSLPAFRGYLQTTGLRTYPDNGVDKPGFTQLSSELKLRGW